MRNIVKITYNKSTMTKQIIFAISLLITLGIFTYTMLSVFQIIQADQAFSCWKLGQTFRGDDEGSFRANQNFEDAGNRPDACVGLVGLYRDPHREH